MTFEEALAECPEPWRPIARELHEELLKIDPDYRVDQIKEKMGGLRYYITPSENMDTETRRKMQILTFDAEKKSNTICQVCGEPGECKSKRGWYATLCETHKMK